MGRFITSAAVASLVVAGCGGKQPHDNTGKFVSCLVSRGGERVTAGAQLRAFPTRGLDWGEGAALDSIDYDTVQAGDSVLVFAYDPFAPVGNAPRDLPGTMLAQARQGTSAAKALVLLEGAPEATVGDCSELAAPGEIFP